MHLLFILSLGSFSSSNEWWGIRRPDEFIHAQFKSIRLKPQVIPANEHTMITILRNEQVTIHIFVSLKRQIHRLRQIEKLYKYGAFAQ